MVQSSKSTYITNKFWFQDRKFESRMHKALLLGTKNKYGIEMENFWLNEKSYYFK